MSLFKLGYLNSLKTATAWTANIIRLADDVSAAAGPPTLQAVRDIRWLNERWGNVVLNGDWVGDRDRKPVIYAMFSPNRE